MDFADRRDAGRRLAVRLEPQRAFDPLVMALPRGGVPVAVEVAAHLGAPLDVLVVRKIGHPRQPEYAVGALGEDGVVVLADEARTGAMIDRAELEAVITRESAELARRVERYRGGRPRRPVRGRTVLVVDDGLATGATAKAAVEVLRRSGAARIVVAVPVGPVDTVAELAQIADEVVCLATPPSFRAVGLHYDDFGEVGDDEVVELLQRSGPGLAPASESVILDADGTSLAADLVVPAGASSLVLFAHGSGSSRHSPRNRYVAGVLQRAGIATLLLDLLSEAEEPDRNRVFDIELLAQRLVAATTWARARVGDSVAFGYFGASTGAAAALVAAARLAGGIGAVVSRGGRPDLAGPALAAVTAPTLLIVGGDDPTVLDLNRRAASAMTRCDHELVVVPGATHLFEEPGTLETAAGVAADWFGRHLGATTGVVRGPAA